MINKQIPTFSNRPSIIYVSTFIIILTGIGFVQMISSLFIAPFYYLAVFLAFVLGFLHLNMINKLTSPEPSAKLKNAVVITGLIVFFSITISFILSLALNLHVTFLSYIIPFALPFLVSEAYKYYLQIPQDQYKIWYYPVKEEVPVRYFDKISETDTVPFVLSKEPNSVNQTELTIQSPVDIPLGLLFYTLINKYNSTNTLSKIQHLKDGNQPFGWLFFVKRQWLKKSFFVDPDLSFRQNIIRAEEVIYATRVLEGQIPE